MAEQVTLWETELKEAGVVEVSTLRASNSDETARVILDLIGKKDREFLIVLSLDKNNYITGVHELAKGTSDHVVTTIAAVIRFACLTGSHRIIIGHNHPMGNVLNVSEEDIELTLNISRACCLHNIELLDSIIVDYQDRYLSICQIIEINEKIGDGKALTEEKLLAIIEEVNNAKQE